MSLETKKSAGLIALTILFCLVAIALFFDVWGHPVKSTVWPPVDSKFTNTATVRMSAAQLIKSGEDTSTFDCYGCHDKKKPVQLHLDAKNHAILPPEHNDLKMQHGRNNRNDNCFNCHDSENLDHLKTKDGHSLAFSEASKLCGSCHGPTYRDWEIGIHGRVSGYWNRKLGAPIKQDCTSCHNPHAPAFPQIQPAPRPHGLHEVAGKKKEHD